MPDMNPTIEIDGAVANAIATDRQRLTAWRTQVVSQKQAHDQQCQQTLDTIDRELAAITAYEQAKAGKTFKQVALPGNRRRSKRGSRREEICQLVLLAQSQGLSRGELLEKMGVKGDKSGEMSVSNALTNLTKRNDLRRESGKYYPGATLTETQGQPQLANA